METLNGNHGFTRESRYEMHKETSHPIYARFALIKPQPFYKYLITAMLHRILYRGLHSVSLRPPLEI